MKKSTKAALSSALILPGAGHIFLKKYVRATLLIGVSLTALYVLIANLIERAVEITDKILNGEIPPDYTIISELISKQSTGSETIELSAIILIVAWLIGILDSYRIGRQLDD